MGGCGAWKPGIRDHTLSSEFGTQVGFDNYRSGCKGPTGYETSDRAGFDESDFIRASFVFVLGAVTGQTQTACQPSFKQY